MGRCLLGGGRNFHTKIELGVARELFCKGARGEWRILELLAT